MAKKEKNLEIVKDKFEVPEIVKLKSTRDQIQAANDDINAKWANVLKWKEENTTRFTMNLGRLAQLNELIEIEELKNAVTGDIVEDDNE